MSQKSSAPAARPSAAAKPPAERVVRDIRRRTRKHHSAEDKIRVVLEGLRGGESIAALCRREGIAERSPRACTTPGRRSSSVWRTAPNGKRRLAGDTARAATTDEVKALRQEARTLKEVVAEQALELRLLKTYGPPRLQAVSVIWLERPALTHPASGPRPRPRWRAARPGPHKSTGVERRFSGQDAKAPVQPSGHLPSATCRHSRPAAPERARPIS
jgi:transposase